MLHGILSFRRRTAERATARRRREVGSLPIEEKPPRRSRVRRGGPRTPLPLVGLVAICAGIGVAYVGQVAHATQATYQASDLQVQQSELRSEASRLDAQLDELRATERIVAAAQKLGMRPAGQWAYVASKPVPVLQQPRAQLASDNTPGDPVQRFIAALGSAVGVSTNAP